MAPRQHVYGAQIRLPGCPMHYSQAILSNRLLTLAYRLNYQRLLPSYLAKIKIYWADYQVF